MSTEFLSRTFLENTVESYIWFAAIIIVGLIFKKIISKLFTLILFRSMKKYSGKVTSQEFHDLLKKPLSLLFILIIGFIAVNYLSFPPEWNIASEEKFGVRMVIHKLYQTLLIVSITWIILRIVDFFGLILLYRASITESKADDQLIPFFKDGLKIFVVVMCFFFILAAVFSVNIVTLIGGLGIGGLAVALAAKETLENLFGSFTIFLDKPFIVGDNVKIGAINGHVEKIGLRSTRIRTLDKSMVIVPNKKMVDAETENITERTFWRTNQDIGLVYSTTSGDIKNIVAQTIDLLGNHEMISENPIVLFDSFGSSSLNLRIIYLVRTSDATAYFKVKEEINFKIIEIVRANNSDFAFPTTSIILENTTTSRASSL